MSWKDIIKAPFDYRRRTAAQRAISQGQSELRETEPKEDLSTDISKFASEYIDSQYKRSGRAFAERNRGFSGENSLTGRAWKPLLALIEKYGKNDLEKELGKLYNSNVKITHRMEGKEFEDYVIDF